MRVVHGFAARLQHAVSCSAKQTKLLARCQHLTCLGIDAHFADPGNPASDRMRHPDWNPPVDAFADVQLRLLERKTLSTVKRDLPVGLLARNVRSDIQWSMDLD